MKSASFFFAFFFTFP
ncbi:pheA operon leader peptide PheL [Erwinia aphidicola]